jgi:hydrogenase nickel incorporation protein HypB
MFSMVDVLLVSKIDMLQHFDFDMEVLIERVRKLNENVRIIPVSARTGEGIEEFGGWLKEEVTIWQA